MILKSTALNDFLKSSNTLVYLITGQDPYLSNESALQIKHDFIAKNHADDPPEYYRIDINNAYDWDILIQKASSYNLFTSKTIIEVFIEQKNIDLTTQKKIITYLDNLNLENLILMRALNLYNRELSLISKHHNLCHIYVYNLNANEQLAWIKQQLKKYNLIANDSDHEIAKYIHNYTQNNLLAAMQSINILYSVFDSNTVLSIDLIAPYLSQQSNFALSDINNAYMQNNPNLALKKLRQLQQNDTPNLLLLWALIEIIRNNKLYSKLYTAYKLDISLKYFTNQEIDLEFERLLLSLF